MKTNKNTKNTNLVIWSVLGLTALALFLFGAVNEAEAGVRVKARVNTPYGVVRVDTGHSERYRTVRRAPMPVRRHVDYRVSKQDRKIAKRLASYTGIPKHQLLKLKKQGYRWSEIGRWYELPRQMVKAAKHKKSWKRYVNAGRYNDHCGLDRYHRSDDYSNRDYRDNRDYDRYNN